jgi:hypothetical protein
MTEKITSDQISTTKPDLNPFDEFKMLIGKAKYRTRYNMIIVIHE